MMRIGRTTSSIGVDKLGEGNCTSSRKCLTQTRGTVSCISVVYTCSSTCLIHNFTVHAWNYRRYVLASLPGPPANSSTPARTPASELAYTQEKIEANFSNFSAWHQRSKVFEATRDLEDPKTLDEGAYPSFLYNPLDGYPYHKSLNRIWLRDAGYVHYAQ